MSPTTFDETYEPRLWRCDECRRVLGVVMRDVNRIRRLWIFWKDCSGDDVPAVPVLRKRPKGLFRVHGVDQCHGVECSRCGALNEWSISKESFNRLMLRYAKVEA
jgi:hypothetical protein